MNATSRLLRGVLLVLPALQPACDDKSGDKASPAVAKEAAPPTKAEAKGEAPAKAEAPIAKAEAPVAKAEPAAAPPPTEPAPPTCRTMLEHITAVLRTTGSEATKAALKSPESSIARCEAQTNDPVLMKCFMDAATEADVDACNLSGFPGQVDGTPKRKVDGKANNAGLEPPIFTVDGDYMSYDADCGMLYREAPPAGALFISCNDTVKIGPIVNAKKLESVMAEISDASRSRHEMVMGIIDNYPKGKLGVKVHVYDADGTYRGIEER